MTTSAERSEGDAESAEVLRRARREAERYGDDPWVFLRELVQNARDAGAAHIALRTSRDAEVERLVCDDDGGGMSPALVETGLLRLFSSQKPLTGAAGCFGVGFWSTLRFDPERVLVETHDGKTATSIVVDVRTGSVTEATPTRTTRGTTVALERAPQDARIAERVRAAVARSAGCIAPLPGRRVPSLTVDGVDVRRRMGEDAFEEGDPRARVAADGFSGVVGFGRRPRVEVYVHGLLVKEALSLDELLPSRSSKARFAAGLWPIVAVEVPGVTVLLDRQAIVEDALVRRLVETCEATLAGLLEKLLDELVPLPWWRRVAARAARRAPIVVFASAIALGGIGGALVNELVLERPTLRALTTSSLDLARDGAGDSGDAGARSPLAEGAPSAPRLLEDMVSPDAPRVDELNGADPGWSLSVTTAEPMLHLRFRVLDRVDRVRGIVASTRSAASAQGTPTSAPLEPLDVVADVSFAARTSLQSLPHAPGTSVMLGGTRGSLVVDAHGLSSLQREPGAGVVRYRLVRGERLPEPPPLVRGVLPTELIDVANELARLPPAQRVRAAERYVSGRLAYGADAATRAALERAPGGFFDRVLATGVGDCDVVNTVLAALLVETGIPARVSIGFVVQNGVVGAALHAWTEAFVDGGITILDASPPVAVATSAGAPGGAHVHQGADAPAGARADALAKPSVEGAAAGVGGARLEPAGARASGAALAPSTDATVDVLAPPGPLSRLSSTPFLIGALLVLVAIFAVLVGAILGIVSRRSRGRTDVDLTAIFVQALRRGARSDPLGLWHRELLPRHRGRPLSLHEAERLAGCGLLGVGGQGGARAEHALVAGDPRVEAVRPFLFGLVDLDRAAAALALPVDARARAVEAAAGEVEPKTAARVVPGKGLTELSLPTANPRVLVLLGADDAVDVDAALALYRRSSSLARRTRRPR